MLIKFKICKLSGGDAGELYVSSSNFGVSFNEVLVHQVVVAYQAKGRQGTRSQKNRAAVSGGSAKPWRQKGTGRARAGTLSSPIFRGGGRAFPSTTHNFSQKVNRKMYRAAIRSILSELYRQKRLIIIDELFVVCPKTKHLLNKLSNLKLTASALLVTSEMNRNVELSARNLRLISICSSEAVNPIKLISHETLIMTQNAAKQIDKMLQ